MMKPKLNAMKSINFEEGYSKIQIPALAGTFIRKHLEKFTL